MPFFNGPWHIIILLADFCLLYFQENRTMLKYHDLITIFEGSLTKVSAQEQVYNVK